MNVNKQTNKKEYEGLVVIQLVKNVKKKIKLFLKSFIEPAKGAETQGPYLRL